MEKFSQMIYTRPDVEGFAKKFAEKLEEFRSAKSYEQLKAIYFEMQEMQLELRNNATLCHVRNTMDMTDPFYEAEQAFLDEAMPALMPLFLEADKALLATPFRKEMEAEYGSELFAQAEISVKTQTPELVPLLVKENALRAAYSKKAASCHTEFRGEDCNFYGLLKHMQSADRDERKEAFFAWAGLYETVAAELDDIYSRLTELRQEKAKILGYENFIPLGYLDMGRTDWTNKEVKSFRKQVQEVVVPACVELLEAQKKRIGVEKLHYYDESFRFCEGNPTPHGSMEEMVGWAGEMYRELSPETGEFFDFMTRYELFDLVTRPGKRPGGYMTLFTKEKAPFIFSNFNGTSADVDVLTHEAGHAFQGYLASRNQELAMYWGSTSEVNEIHSMSMEFFAYPWMDKFFGEDAARYRYAHLSDCVLTIPYLVMVDDFQEQVYAAGNPSAEERYAIWNKLEKIYLPWRDYDGQEMMEKGGFWMQKQHIFLYPFYYVDYALAQICAMQFYVLNHQDPKAAWQGYMDLCLAGGSKNYSELLRVAKLESPFADGTVKKVIDPVMEELRKSPYHQA